MVLNAAQYGVVNDLHSHLPRRRGSVGKSTLTTWVKQIVSNVVRSLSSSYSLTRDTPQTWSVKLYVVLYTKQSRYEREKNAHECSGHGLLEEAYSTDTKYVATYYHGRMIHPQA